MTEFIAFSCSIDSLNYISYRTLVYKLVASDEFETCGFESVIRVLITCIKLFVFPLFTGGSRPANPFLIYLL